MKRIGRSIPHFQQPRNSALCGAVCLQMLYASYGIDMPLDAIWDDVKAYDPVTHRNNCRIAKMAQHARALGLDAMIVVCEKALPVIEACLTSGIDVIALCRSVANPSYGHYVVITGMTDQDVLLNDPELDASRGKNRKIKKTSFLQCLRPLSNAEFGYANTLLLLSPAGSAQTVVFSLSHDDCVQRVELFAAVMPYQPLIVCLEHERFFLSGVCHGSMTDE